MKLTYFNLRARAELARLVMVQAGVEFEDERVDGDQWKELKPNSKWGSLPLLEDGDLCLGQSVGIARYLANKYGLAGKDNMEQFSCDAIVDTIADWFSTYVKYRFAKDEDKEQTLESLKKNVQVALAALNKQLTDKGGKFMVGDALTWADLAVFNILFMAKDQEELAELKDQMTPLMEIYDMVAALPNIKKWVENRPVTDV